MAARTGPNLSGPVRVALRYVRPQFVESALLPRLVAEGAFADAVADARVYLSVADARPEELWSGLDVSRGARSEDSLLTERLVRDARGLADRLRPTFESSGRAHGYVILPLSPHLADDAPGLANAARALRRAVERDNVAVEIPATDAGLSVVPELLSEGAAVEVVALADPARLERILRVLPGGVERDRRGRSARVSIRLSLSPIDAAAAPFGSIPPAGSPWPPHSAALDAARECERVWSNARGTDDGRPRLVWSEVEPPDPAWPATSYIDRLTAGPDSAAVESSWLFTHPKPTRAVDSTGTPSPHPADDGGSHPRVAIEFAELARGWRDSKVAAYDRLRTRVRTLRPDRPAASRFGEAGLSLPADVRRAVAERLGFWSATGFGRRLWTRDPRLWFDAPRPELSDRMGWLELPFASSEYLRSLATLAESVVRDDVRHAVLVGMGGSSLAPSLFAQVFGPSPGFPDLTVLDSSHPDAVTEVSDRLDLDRAVFVVSSKSGTTAETLSLFRHFWAGVARSGGRPGRRFMAITDPGTPLVDLARTREFRAWIPGPPEVGGRYSALSAFGLVPAALLGVDLVTLLERASALAVTASFDTPEAESPSLALGAALGELGVSGRDKVTFLAPPALSALPVWIEQLIAESTGKDRRGLVPVVEEAPRPPDRYAQDRVFVSLEMARDESTERRRSELERAGRPVIRLELRDIYDVGAEFFRWELAVAAAGSILGIHPFDQPDVELAKRLTRAALRRGKTEATAATPSGPELLAAPPEDRARAVEGLGRWLDGIRAPEYVAIQAYLAPRPETDRALAALREYVALRTGVATTLGYGPRFLHSTGQLHKGGPETVRCLQLRDRPRARLPIPETEDTFEALVAAQAEGDAEALRQRGRPPLVLELGDDPVRALDRLVAAPSGVRGPGKEN
jgi:transaldolase/glucose-6-phosphate isomerase